MPTFAGGDSSTSIGERFFGGPLQTSASLDTGPQPSRHIGMKVPAQSGRRTCTAHPEHDGRRNSVQRAKRPRSLNHHAR